MRNDPPTNLRMTFGYGQARAAGLGGIRPDRSPRQVNMIVHENKTMRAIRKEFEKDTGWAPFIMHWIDEGLSAEQILTSLQRAQHFARWRARGGISSTWYLRIYGQPF